MRVNGECPWSTGGGHAVPWGYYEEPVGKRGVSHPPGYENGSYECRVATYCGHDGCPDKRKPPPVKEEPRVTGELARVPRREGRELVDLIREYAEVRSLLDKMTRRASRVLDPDKCGDREGCRRDLWEVTDEAFDILRFPEHDRCTATFRHSLAVQEGLEEFSCVRRSHEDPWHTAGGPGRVLDRWSVKRPEIMVRLTELTRSGDARPGGFQECDALPWFDHRLWRKALPWKIPRYWLLEMWVPQEDQGHTNSVQHWVRTADTNSPGLRRKWDRARERAQERAETCYFVSGTEGIGGF